MKKNFTIITAIALAIQVNAQSWTPQNSNFPLDATYPLAIDAKGESIAWAYGADGSGGGLDYRVYTKTGNGGTTWMSGAMSGIPASVAIADIAAGDGNTAWVVGYPNPTGGGVWKTSDGGTTWVKQTTASFSNPASFPDVIYFWDLNTGVAIGDPLNNKLEVYTTTDGGTTWTANAAGGAANAGEYAYVHNKAVVGNTIWCGSNQGRIYRSNDKGLTWLSTISTPLSDFGGAGESGEIVLKDSNTAWIASSLGILYKTTDGGANFVDIPTVSGTFYALTLEYVPGTNQTLLSGGASSTLGRGSSISYDGGANWTEIANTNADTGITAIAASSPTAIYGGTFVNAGIGGMNKLTALLATSEASVVKGLTISPNPTFGDLNISTVLNIKSVEILDMNGRIIKTFGADAKKLDLSNLQNGVYAVKVNTVDGKSKIAKFIKK
ncbi:MAG: T9SS type A sorting domain-containing protein [Weeksellaceae bacterium]|nr:T9SS type A sorting domain-containing protein [Weeksellaceae bacterium]